jgi:hypothetical protein
VGWVNNKDLYILDKDNYTKESKYKYSNERYFSLMKHELAHSCFQVISGSTKSEPDWLWEGTATYLAGQINDKKTELSSFLKYYKKDMGSSVVYTEGGIAVKYLVEKHGKTKLLKLIRSLKGINSEKEFRKVFERIYGFELEYRNFTDMPTKK